MGSNSLAVGAVVGSIQLRGVAPCSLLVASRADSTLLALIIISLSESRRLGGLRTFIVIEHSLSLPLATVRVGRARQHRVVGMGLDMFLEILRPFEGFATKVTLMRLERHMNSDVGGDVVPLDRGGVTGAPCTGQVEIIRRLAAHMAFADMFLGDCQS